MVERPPRPPPSEGTLAGTAAHSERAERQSAWTIGPSIEDASVVLRAAGSFSATCTMGTKPESLTASSASSCSTSTVRKRCHRAQKHAIQWSPPAPSSRRRVVRLRGRFLRLGRAPARTRESIARWGTVGMRRGSGAPFPASSGPCEGGLQRARTVQASESTNLMVADTLVPSSGARDDHNKGRSPVL